VGLPGLSGFIGEYLAMQGAFRADWVVGAITAFVVILAAWYLLWMFQRVMFNRFTGDAHHFPDADRIEAGSLIVLGVLSILMGIFPGPILDMLQPLSREILRLTETVAANPEVIALFK
jgi:NADH-quinone oxidoreductase subunit M